MIASESIVGDATATRSSPRPHRVLVIGARKAADSMESHVVDGLEEMGISTELFSTRPRIEALGNTGNEIINKAVTFLFREPERLSESALIRAAARADPDLVLVLQGNQLSPKSIARLRTRCKAPIVCWCQDHLGTLGRQYLLGAGYDAVFVKDRYMQELFSRMLKGTPFYYLPEACNPQVHRPLVLSDEDRQRYGCEVMIFGSMYYYRQEILRHLGEFDLKIWGNAPGWFVQRLESRRAGGEVVLDNKVRAVRAAKIALNTLQYSEVNALNCRAFELAGCGAFQLVTSRPVLGEHFKIGAELDAFDSVDELIEKIRYYLRHPEKTAEMAANGRKRAHSEHTYVARLREIFRIALNYTSSATPARDSIRLASRTL